MQVKEHFRNVFTYAAGIEAWCKKFYAEGGNSLEYTFASDFAIADWYGKDEVLDTYERVKESWLNDYKAFTEVAIALNLLSWANHQLTQQGFEGREEFTQLYSELYYRAMDDFYTKYEGNNEATSHFFEMTD